MNYQQFKTVIEALESVRDRCSVVYDIGIDLLNYDEPYHKVISTLMESVFDKEDKGWIDWYLYERQGFDGKILNANDKNGNEICHNIESLWETVKPYRKQ